MPNISVIIITKNEARDIRACLESVSWADEIIVLDSGSSDDTTSIARSFTPHVHTSADWRGFGIQKNRALAFATGKWVLSLDADERLTAELSNEIQALLQNTTAESPIKVYEMPRRSSYCGVWIKHAGWYPDYVTRLFQRGCARFSDDVVHERLIFECQAGRLESDLLHYSFRDFEEVLEKTNSYSSAGAQKLLARNQRIFFTSAILHGSWTFFRTYILKLGILDGRMGFALAVSNAYGAYYRYLKAWLLQNQKNP